MTILTDYQAGTPTTMRARLSNIDDSAPTSPDTAFEATIATQAEGMFKTFAYATYSSSNSRHVALGVKLMRNLIRVATQDDPDGLLEDRLNATIDQLGILGEGLTHDESDAVGS